MVSLFGYEVVEGWHIDFKNHLMSTFVDLRDVDIHEFVEEGFGTSFTVRAVITFPPDTSIEINTDN